MCRLVFGAIPLFVLALVPAVPVEAAPAAGTLTLREVLARTLVQSPRLAEYAVEVRAAEARRIQAGLYPNPELSIEAEDLRWTPGPESRSMEHTLDIDFDASGLAPTVSVTRDRSEGDATGFSHAEFTVEISQVVLLGGKRIKSVRAAEQAIDVARWDYEVARADALTAAAAAFFDAFADQEHVRARKELAEVAEQVEATVAARVEAGDVSPMETRRAAIEAASARAAYRRALGDWERSRALLAAHWGAIAPDFEKVNGDWEAVEPLPPLADLTANGQGLPDYHRWTAELARREADTAVARADAVPDIEVTLGVKASPLWTSRSRSIGFEPGTIGLSREVSSYSESRDYTFILSASIPLPFFDRNQGNILEAEHEAAKAHHALRALEADVAAAIRGAYETTAARHDEVMAIRGEILPLAERNLSDMEMGYREGKFDLLNVLDAERTLIELRDEYIEALADYHQNRIELERWAGDLIDAHGLEDATSAPVE